MRISDWSSDVCSSDLLCEAADDENLRARRRPAKTGRKHQHDCCGRRKGGVPTHHRSGVPHRTDRRSAPLHGIKSTVRQNRRHHFLTSSELCRVLPERSEEHTSELQSLMRISYAVFRLHKNTQDESHKQTSLPQNTHNRT